MMSRRELQLDIKPYAERHPDSSVLQQLAEAADIPDPNDRDSALKGWWERLSAEHEVGLPADVVVAAVTHVMRRAETESELADLEVGPENARMLRRGAKVVAIDWRNPDNYGFVRPELSGVLAEDAVAALHSSVAAVNLGLRFTDTRNGRLTHPESPFAVGDEAIRDFYDKTLASDVLTRQAQAEKMGAGLLDLITTIAKLGVESDDPKADNLKQRAIEELSTKLNTLSYLVVDGEMEVLALPHDLKRLHTLAPEVADEVIKTLATKEDSPYERPFWLYERHLIDGVAAVKSSYQYDSEVMVKLGRALAAVSVYALRSAFGPSKDNR